MKKNLSTNIIISLVIVTVISLSSCTKKQKQFSRQKTYTKAYKETYKETYIDRLKRLLDNFHIVEKKALYRSKQLNPRRLKKYILRYNIKTVINLRGTNANSKWWKKELSVVDNYRVKFYNIPMSAQRLSSRKELKKLLTLFKYAPRPILIHCLSGSDRTGEAAALWVIEQQKLSKKTALKQLSYKYGHIKLRRPAKQFLIKKWQNYKWLVTNYDPANYLSFK